uniref:Conserved oligomeric Golgi complex subunit 7 n=1 Tax=Timema cristinae TaxID=61476 RepID=A0A7R9CQP3_TIMCR|nr:unnamed protein product [Timema cristinae]
MDIAAFSDDNFEAKAWINKTFKSAEAQENKDAFVSSLVMKLQLYVQQVNSALEDTSQQVLQSLPRVMRDTELLHQEALLLREKMQLVKVEIAKVEQDTGQSMATLERIDNIKTELQAAKQALHEADNWIILAADLEEVFESGDIESISAKLVSMQQSLLILANVPDYEDRKLQLEGLKNRLEAMASPLLVQAFTSGSIGNSTSEIHSEVLGMYGDDCQDCSNISIWCTFYDDVQVNLADQPRSGRPATTSTLLNVVVPCSLASKGLCNPNSMVLTLQFPPPSNAQVILLPQNVGSRLTTLSEEHAAAPLETKFMGGLRSDRLEQATSATGRLVAH